MERIARGVGELTEVPAWAESTRVIILTSADGVRQWRVEGLASNITPTSLRLLADLLELAERRDANPQAARLAQ